LSATLSAPVDVASAPVGPSTDALAAHHNQYVTFDVAGEMFAVPMAPVQEIIRVPAVARLPLSPPALDGLANLRGRVLPIVNLRRLFNTEPRPHDDATRALVINLGQPLGFVVDRVASVVSVEPGEIEAVSAISTVVQTDCLTGVIKRRASDGSTQMMLVLDFQQLISAQFSSAAQGHASEAGRSLDSAPAQAADQRDAAASDDLRLVSFMVCQQEYAIDIAAVQEIVQMPGRVTALPNTPRHVLGVISLRQRLLPLVSLRCLFGLPDQAPDEQHRIVVVALPNGHQVGLVTDSVKEVLSVPRHQAEAMPGVLARDQRLEEFESICRLDDGKRLVSIIATDKLLGLQGIRDALRAAQSETPAAASGDTPSDGADAMTSQSPSRATLGDDAQVVIFRLGSEEFGVPIMSVQEIVRVPEALTRVPKTPPWVEGVINLRGTVLPVVDQRSRLGMDTIERNDRQRIMVYMLAGMRTGFIVDSVAEVLRIGHARIEPAPALSDEQSRLITQVAKLDGDKRLVMLIDPSQLLGAREAQVVESLVDSERAADLALPKAA
jgi:purine-binding chemotaxis protein CheW